MRTSRIGICDDEEMVAFVLKKKIDDCLKRMNIEAEVRIYSSGIELLKEIGMLDVVFLDLEMPDMDGIEVGKRIIEENKDCQIIVETGKEYRYKEAFHINARRFITKPFDEEEIEEALQCIYRVQMGMEKIELYKDRVKYEVKQRNIEYIEAYDGYTEFHLNGMCFRKEISLNNLEKILDDRIFVRVTPKYMLNLLFVDRYERGIFYIGERKIRSSRRKRKNVEKRYREFDLSFI